MGDRVKRLSGDGSACRLPWPDQKCVETSGDVIGVIINEDGVPLSSFIFRDASLMFWRAPEAARGNQ
jgi:hypothetical protein